MDRRDFLASSAVAAVGLGLHPGSAAGAPVAERLSRDQLAQLVGSTFTAVDEGGAVRRLTLAAVRPGPETPRLDQFALMFDHGDDPRACAGLCWMRHPEIGWFQLRLDAVGNGGCSATFSLLR